MSTLTNKGAENLKNGFLLFRLVAFIVQKYKSTKGQKNTGECFTPKLKSTCKNSGTFEEKKFQAKNSLTLVLPQAIQLSR